jgi:hypothetical protein
MILTLALLAAQAQDLTLQPGAVLNGVTVNGNRAASECDDFNRADGPMSGSWTQIAGQQNILSNQGYGNVGTGNQWMQHSLASSAASTAVQSLEFAANPGGGLVYAALVSGVGAGNGFFVKLQAQGSTMYNFLGFYVGFNGGGGCYGQFAGITPVVSGRMDVYYDSGADKMVLDIDEFNNGSVDYTYTSNGAASCTGSLAATGCGIGTYGPQLYDNYELNGGCGGASYTLAATAGCNNVVTFSTANGSTSGKSIVIYGNAGSKTKPGGVCAGTTVQIANPKKFVSQSNTGAGTSSSTVFVSAAFCGQTFQAVDIPTCTVSNTLVL